MSFSFYVVATHRYFIPIIIHIQMLNHLSYSFINPLIQFTFVEYLLCVGIILDTREANVKEKLPDLQGSYSFPTEWTMHIKTLGAVSEVCTGYCGRKAGCVRLFWKGVGTAVTMKGMLERSAGRRKADRTRQLYLRVWGGHSQQMTLESGFKDNLRHQVTDTDLHFKERVDWDDKYVIIEITVCLA